MLLSCFAYSMRTFLFITILVICLQSYQADPVPVTHEDIRDVMLKMVRVMASTESKLHRHEIRERIFSEHLRKSLITLDKRLNKMDEKISKLLDSRNDDKDVVVKINDSLNKIPLVINDLKSDIIHKLNSNAKTLPTYHADPIERNSTITQSKMLKKADSSEEDAEESSTEVIQSLTNKLEVLQKDLTEVKGVQIKSYEIIEKVQMELKNKDELFQDILNKLDGYNLEVPPQDAAIPSEWQIEVIEALERQESVVEMTLAQVKTIRNESLNEIKFLEESIKDMTNHSGVFLENVLKDLVKIQDSNVAATTNLTWKVDALNLAIEDVRITLTEISKTDQTENFQLYMNDSMKNLEKVCNNEKATNKILEDLNGVKKLEERIENVTNYSKAFLENITKDFTKIFDSRAREIANLTQKVDTLNLVMEDMRTTVTDITKIDQNENLKLYINDSIKNLEKVCNNEKILEDLNEVKKLEERIENVTNYSKAFLENLTKDFTKIFDSRAGEITNLTWKVDILNLVMEDVRRTVSEMSEEDQKENFELYLNDSMKNLEKICNDATNKIIKDLDEMRMLEESVKDTTTHSKAVLENLLKDFVKMEDSRVQEIGNLTMKMDVLDLVMVELRETVSESYLKQVCNKQDATKILEALQEQSATVFGNLGDIKALLDDSRSSENNSTKQILGLLDNLSSNVENNGDKIEELSEKVESILSNEEQTLEFNRKSSQDIIDKIETMQITIELNSDKL